MYAHTYILYKHVVTSKQKSEYYSQVISAPRRLHITDPDSW